jgi:hypothetical protein
MIRSPRNFILDYAGTGYISQAIINQSASKVVDRNSDEFYSPKRNNLSCTHQHVES